MKNLETLIGAFAPEPVANPWGAGGSRAFCESAAPVADRGRSASPGLLPRGEEAFDWRVVAGRMTVAADREAEIARGLTDPTEKARREARADVWLTAAANVREEAARKGLA